MFIHLVCIIHEVITLLNAISDDFFRIKLGSIWDIFDLSSSRSKRKFIIFEAMLEDYCCFLYWDTPELTHQRLPQGNDLKKPLIDFL